MVPLLVALCAFGGQVEGATAPRANADYANVDEDSSVLIDVLVNDTDRDAGDVLSIISVGSPRVAGSQAVLVAISGRQYVRYTPARNSTSADSFTYIISDKTNRRATGKVSVSVNKVNDAPSLILPALIEVAAGSQSISLPVSVTEVDGEKVSLSVSTRLGTLLWTSVSGISVSGGKSGTAAITLTGTAATLNAALAGLRYQPVASGPVADSLQVSLADSTYRVQASASIVLPGTLFQYAFDEAAGSRASGGVSAYLAGLLPGAGWTPGFAGSALKTTAGTWAEAASAPAMPIDRPFSLSVRMRTDVTLSQMAAAYPALVAQQDWDGNAGFYLGSLGAHGNQFGVRVFGGSSQGERAEIVTTMDVSQTWMHLCAVSDGTVLTLYINGAAVGTAQLPAGIRPASVPLAMGWGGFEGAIDDVRFVQRAFSATEVATLAGSANADPAALITLPLATSAVQNQSTRIPSEVVGGTAPSTTWSLLAGPGKVTIGNLSALDSTFVFKSTGTYLLRLTATSGSRTASRDVQVQVSSVSAITGAGTSVATGLVANWTFENGYGALVDDITLAGHDGVKTASALWITDGISGGAMSFAGDDGSVQIVDADALRLQTFTLATWVRPAATQPSPYPSLITKQSWTGNAGYLLGGLEASTGGTGLRLLGGSSVSVRSEQSMVPLPPGAWTHVAASYDGEQLRLYCNGALVSAQTIGAFTISHDAAPLLLGWFFRGDLDGVRIYNRALSLAETQVLATQPALAGAKPVMPLAAN